MLKRILAARKHVAIGLAVGLAAVALCAGADEARIRHMADTYLQSDGTQYIDTGYIGSTNLRVEVVFEPVLTNSTRYLFGSASNGAATSSARRRTVPAIRR